jgi:two-component system, cell cycle response regulator
MPRAMRFLIPDRASGVALAVIFVPVALVGVLIALPQSEAWHDVPYHGALFLAAAVCVARGVFRDTERVAWVLIGTSIALWTIGDLYWVFVLEELGDAAPYPSVADWFWLAFYPPIYVGLVLLVRARVADFRASFALDGIIGALALASVACALVFSVVLDATGGSPAAVATNLAYPLADTLLLAIVVGVLGLTGWRPGRAWAWLAAGLAVFAVTDSLYLYQVSVGTYEAGTMIDLGWPLGAGLLAAAAWQPAVRQTGSFEGLRVLVPPTLFGLVAIAVETYDHVRPVTHLAIVLAGAALVAVLVRLSLTFAENLAMIRTSRSDALTDPLTGLGNRRRLLLDLHTAVADDATHETALVMLDLNGFKAYNDAFGHPAGDALLSRLGARLAGVARGRGTVYRLGGDEFCALLAADDMPLDLLTEPCAAAMRESGEGFAISTAFGAVVVPREADTTSAALKLADQRMYAQKHGVRGSAGSQTSSALLQALTERSPDLSDHLLGVAELAVAVARKLELSEAEVEDIRLAASLHDVGKMAIPDAILTKPGPLTEAEWDFIRNHTIAGEKILGAAPALHAVARLVRSSHERFDGGGYPDGLTGTDIPLGSRIIFVCDAFDAIIAERPYREARTVEEAIEEIRRNSGTQFDPAVVAAFSLVMSDRAQLLAV